MKHLFLTLATIIGFIVVQNTYATSQNPDDACRLNNNVFQAGESANYTIYYNWTAAWVKAGTVSFNVANATIANKPAYHFVSEGKSVRTFDWFFKVRDRYESYVEQATIKPLKFLRNISEGDYTLEHNYTFYPEKNQVLINYHKTKGKIKLQNKTVNVSECAQDLLSAVYYSRCINYDKMKIGDVYNMDVFMDGETYPIYIRYKGKENIKTDFGTFRCTKFSPLLLEGDVFKGGEGMTIWTTDDANRLPIYVESPLSVGYIKAYINNYKGLKNPMTAKIK
jgi:hypothetical protein